MTSRLVYAAGYYVPGAYVIDLDTSELSIAPGATYRKHGYDKRRYTLHVCFSAGNMTRIAEALSHGFVIAV